MASAVLQSIVNDIARVNVNIAEAQEMIDFLRRAGEPTSTQEAELKNLIMRKEKWERAAREMGYVV